MLHAWPLCHLNHLSGARTRSHCSSPPRVVTPHPLGVCPSPRSRQSTGSGGLGSDAASEAGDLEGWPLPRSPLGRLGGGGGRGGELTSKRQLFLQGEPQAGIGVGAGGVAPHCCQHCPEVHALLLYTPT